MKELSIAEKAKRFDMVIEKLRNFYRDYDTVSRLIDVKEELANLIPELKESEDERIRKALIRFHKSTIDVDGIKGDDILAWLEKQWSEPNWCHHNVDLSNCSEEYRKAYYDGWNNCNMQHSQCESEKSDVLKCLINGMKFYYEDNKEATWGTEKFSMKVKDILSWLEKQGEQKITDKYNIRGIKSKHAKGKLGEMIKEMKTADKVEPKFKVGDWVIFNEHHNSVYQVEKIQGLRYYLRHYLGGTLSVRFDTELIRLWTLQDAKSGDVLVDKYNNIGIYKEIEGIYWDSYIYLGCDGKLYDFSVGGMHDQTQTHPATKGQRDNLLKAMAEAGWDFDFEKKELKKIKPIDEYEGLTDFERAVADACIGFIGKELGWKQYVKDSADDLLKIAVKKFNAVQNDSIQINPSEYINDMGGNGCYLKNTAHASAWSEEDESIALGIEQIVNCASLLNIAPDKLDKVRNWLKSIKDRVACEANCTTTKQWKPSEEQVKVLEFFIPYVTKCSIVLQKSKDTLLSLLADLKKLREE